MSAKKLAAGVSLTAGFGTLSAFVAGFLWGFTFGAEAAIHQTKDLRRVAECKGEGGCEWSYHRGFGPFAGEPSLLWGRPTATTGPWSGCPCWGGPAWGS